MTDPDMTKIENTKPSFWKRRTTLAGIATGAIALTGAGVIAFAADRAPDPNVDFINFGHHGHHGFMSGAKADFMEFRLGRALDAVGASAEQKDKIKAILSKARETVESERGEPGDMRQQMADLLKSPTIDRSAIEALRAKRVATMDEVSKTMTTALLDAADVLTPEQRAKLATEFQGHRPRW